MSLAIIVLLPQTVLTCNGLCACGPPFNALRIMSVEIGVRLKQVPPSASEMALTMAAAADPFGGSPTPLTPTGFAGSGNSTAPQPISDGTSSQVGGLDCTISGAAAMPSFGS